MHSAHVVFRLAARYAFRWARNAFLSSGGMLCVRALRRAFISCLCSADIFLLASLLQAFISCLFFVVRFSLAALLLAFLSSIVLFCLDALRRAFISALCSGVRLFLLALSRLCLCWYLTCLMLALEAISLAPLGVPRGVVGFSPGDEGEAGRLMINSCDLRGELVWAWSPNEHGPCLTVSTWGRGVCEWPTLQLASSFLYHLVEVTNLLGAWGFHNYDVKALIHQSFLPDKVFLAKQRWRTTM